jgi:serine/threonine-protein kinase
VRFVRELGYRISHPHVVAPLGWVGEDDRVLFTMELVDGGSVATLLGDYGRLPSEWTAVLLDQLLSALEACMPPESCTGTSSQGTSCSRDRQGAPACLLGDFGIAAPVSGPRLTSQSIVLGTLGYLAPEQLRGAAPEARQDLFAAGAVAAELLTGRRDALWGGESAHADATSDVPDGVPAGLWSVVRGLTAQAPADRYPSAAAARAALAASGCVPAAGAPLADDGLEIEVLRQVAPLPPREDRNTVRSADAPAADARPPDPVVDPRDPAAADTAATSVLPTEVHSRPPPDDGAPRPVAACSPCSSRSPCWEPCS